jgi:hypothetical protein
MGPSRMRFDSIDTHDAETITSDAPRQVDWTMVLLNTLVRAARVDRVCRHEAGWC